MSSLKEVIYKLHWILSAQFGINLIVLCKGLSGCPLFLRDLFQFRKIYSGKLRIKPCLHDRWTQAGEIKNEYFWQDLAVAQFVFSDQPPSHLDIGSRIDGFVAHVASFRPIDVIDVRPLDSNIPNVHFHQLDITRRDAVEKWIELRQPFASVSCLHALEHFGLGRYGDSLDVNASYCGIANLANLVANNGLLYLSTPVGREIVDFNANRIFDPSAIISLAREENLHLSSLYQICNQSPVRKVDISEENIKALKTQTYCLLLFVFRKESPTRQLRPNP